MSKDDVTIHILKKVVSDGFILIGLSLCIYATNVAWLPLKRGFFCDDESLMYPYQDDTINVLTLRLVGLVPAIIAFFICEWAILRKDCSFQRCLGMRIPAWIHGFYSVLISFAIGCCFVELAINISKNTIGRPRPHFFDICQPSIDCSLPESKHRYIQTTDYSCLGLRTEKFADMNKSFLSGHSAWSAFTMLFFAFYLERRMQWCNKIFRHVLQFVAVMFSWYCALSRISDYKHHWSDVLAGGVLGTIFAIVMFVWGTKFLEEQETPAPSNYDITVTSQTARPVQNGTI